MESNRPQHRIANCVIAAVVTAIDVVITASPRSIITGFSCLIMEHYATPDRDIEPRRRQWAMHWWWLIYAEFIPHHRHRLSHSLLLGLPLRLFWTLLPALLIYSFAEPTWGDVRELLQSSVVIRVLLGAIASDIAHYALDGYSPIEMIVGKD